VELASKRAEQLLGTTQAQIAKKHIADIFAKDTDIQFIIDEPQPPCPDPRLLEFNIQLNSETSIPVEATICHIPTDKGTKIILQLRDMRPMAARETRMLKNYELMSNQNKKLVNFAHIVSHNLRAHSSNLESLLALLHETEDETERAQIMLFIEQLAVRFKETVNHLNEIVAVEDHKGLHLEPVNIHHYIHKALDTLVMDIRNTQATIDNLVPENCEIPYSAVYMESILLNLLTNTLKYRHPERLPHVVMTTRLTDDYLVLSIKDNGIGIDLDRFGKKLFGMYATFTDNPEATGIGLFITKNQIESLGGKIEVESTLNVGSTFHIYFALNPQVVSL
jgi:signal transduction histidine kinase